MINLTTFIPLLMERQPATAKLVHLQRNRRGQNQEWTVSARKHYLGILCAQYNLSDLYFGYYSCLSSPSHSVARRKLEIPTCRRTSIPATFSIQRLIPLPVRIFNWKLEIIPCRRSRPPTALLASPPLSMIPQPSKFRRQDFAPFQQAILPSQPLDLKLALGHKCATGRRYRHQNTAGNRRIGQCR